MQVIILSYLWVLPDFELLTGVCSTSLSICLVTSIMLYSRRSPNLGLGAKSGVPFEQNAYHSPDTP